MRTRLVFVRTIRRKAEPKTSRDWKTTGPWAITAPLILASDDAAAEWLAQRDQAGGYEFAVPRCYDIMEREFVE